LRDGNEGWLISEINAGNIGGLFRLEYLGVHGVADRFVDWICHFSHSATRPERLLSKSTPPESLMEKNG
jgi:hypothetical protein